MPTAIRIVQEAGDGDRTLTYRVRLGENEGPRTIYITRSEDRLEDRLRSAIEHRLDYPELDEVEYRRTLGFMQQRGAELAQPILLLEERWQDLTALRTGTDPIEIEGDQNLFSQAWELAAPAGQTPWAVRAPMVRVIAGTRAYPQRPPNVPLSVLVVTARQAIFEDIPPRLISGEIARFGKADLLNVRVLSPSWPNVVEAAIEPGSDGCDVLHIDAHGDLLTFDDLKESYSEQRAIFESKSWGIQIAPFAGKRGFVFLEWSHGTSLPVTGSELGVLARRARAQAVVLNACRAGSVDFESSVATELVQAGVPEVVASRHTLTAEAASILVNAFYTRLAAGGTIGAAASAARRALFEAPERRLHGRLCHVADWSSIVHYAAAERQTWAESQQPMPPELPPFRPLPPSLEWGIYGLTRMLLERRFTYDTARNELLGPVAIVTSAGAGGEAVLQEATNWLGQFGTMGSRVVAFDLSGLEDDSERVDPKELSRQIERAIPPDGLIVFRGLPSLGARPELERTVWRSAMNAAHHQRGRHWALTPRRPIAQCLLTFDRPLESYEGYAGFGFMVLNPSTDEIVDYFKHSPVGRCVADELDLIWFSAWLIAGHAESALELSRIENLSSLIDFLDDISGVSLSGGTHRSQALRARIDSVSPAVNTLKPGLAAFGASFRIEDFAYFDPGGGGLAINDDSRLVTAVTALRDLQEQGLAFGPDPKLYPLSWRAEQFPRLMIVHPELVRAACAELGPTDLRSIHDWAEAWAISKLEFLVREAVWPVSFHDALAYFEAAKPLFASVLWRARRSAGLPADLRRLIVRAKAIQLWPPDFINTEEERGP